jgi:hypothetical protein
MTDNRDDIYGRRARIGYTSPPLTTEVFPYEFYQMGPAGVTLVLTTLAPDRVYLRATLAQARGVRPGWRSAGSAFSTHGGG